MRDEPCGPRMPARPPDLDFRGPRCGWARRGAAYRTSYSLFSCSTPYAGGWFGGRIVGGRRTLRCGMDERRRCQDRGGCCGMAGVGTGWGHRCSRSTMQYRGSGRGCFLGMPVDGAGMCSHVLGACPGSVEAHRGCDTPGVLEKVDQPSRGVSSISKSQIPSPPGGLSKRSPGPRKGCRSRRSPLTAHRAGPFTSGVREVPCRARGG